MLAFLFVLPGLPYSIEQSSDRFGSRASGGSSDSGSRARALCVLDRDDETGPTPSFREEADLGFFTWTRRHIESYLLVPAAIRRAVSFFEDRARLDRILRKHLPPSDDEEVYRELDAKRLLGTNGILPRALGRPISLARIAKVTRETELHDDVHSLFSRLRAELGIPEPPIF